MADAQIKAVITAEDRASATLAKVKGSIEAVGTSASKFLGEAVGTASRIATVGIGALAVAGFSSVKAFEESQNVATQLDAVLKSTGSTAGVTKQSVIELSKQLEHLTGVSDEAVVNSENILLTFTAIGKNIFPTAEKAALDMATALNHGLTPDMQTLQERTILLGKALQDPDTGLGILRRVGVNVDELKKKFTDSMSVQEKQKLILKELNTEFGGTAAAAGKTFAGQLNILKEKINDVQEGIGQFISEGLKPVLTWLNNFIDRVDWQKVLDNARESLRHLKDQVIEFLTPIKDFLEKHKEGVKDFLVDFGKNAIILIPLIAGLTLAFGALTNPLFLIITALTLGEELWKHHQTLFIALTAVIGPLVVAFIALRTALMIQELLTGVNTAILALTGTNVAATLATQGFVAAARALTIALAGPFVLTVVGLAAILLAIQYVHELTSAWNAAAAAENQAQAQQNQFFSNEKAKLDRGEISHAQYAAEIAKYNRMVNPRAMGGAVLSNMPYLVGEQGPELFIPQGSGTIIPNNQIGGGSTIVNINLNAQAFMGSSVEARKFAQTIANHLKDIAGAKNMTVGELLA